MSDAASSDHHAHSHEEAHGNSRANHTYWYHRWKTVLKRGIASEEAAKAKADHTTHHSSGFEVVFHLGRRTEDSLHFLLHVRWGSLIECWVSQVAKQRLSLLNLLLILGDAISGGFVLVNFIVDSIVAHY